LKNLTVLKKHIIPGKLFMLGFIILIAFASCRKKPEQIGADLQPDRDRIQLFHTDTLTVTAYSVREDSVRTDEPARMLLGSISDPVFGITVAGFYTQIRLSTNAPNFGANPVLDSLVLQMAYNGHYGDTSTLQTMRVYEMNEQIFLDSTYYSTRQIGYEPTDLANMQYWPHPKRPFPFLGDTLPPMIRVRLSDITAELGNKILNAPTESLENNEKFVEYVKGLYITVDPVASGGGISYFDLPSNLSRATLYYKNDQSDSLRYELFILTNTPRFNRFEHFNYDDSDMSFKNQVIDGDTTLGQNRLYLQSMGGVKTYIRFPHLRKFAQQLGKNIAINEARLIFTGSEYPLALPAPPQLVLVEAIDNAGNYKIMQDQFEGDAYFGGNYQTSRNEYSFRISRYVQSIIKSDTEDDFGLWALVVGASARADRWVFNGTHPQVTDTIPAFRLQLIYSTID
jgi:hypothetical protein